MRIKIKQILFILPIIIFANTSYGVQILPEAPSFGSEMGKSLGRGAGSAAVCGTMAAMKKKKEKELQRLREEEARKIAEEKAILADILNNYDHAKHAEFIRKIIQSDLSNDTKYWVVDVLNEQHKEYLEEQKNKNGIWSWFKK